MATNFPTSLDTLTNPTATDSVADVSHADQHANANDAIEAIQTKVGIDGDSTTTSHDYKLSDIADGEKAVATSGDQSIGGNKTFTGTTTAGDISSGNISSGNISSTGDISSVNISSGNATFTGSFSIPGDVIQISEGGIGRALSTPADDRILFFDKSSDQYEYLSLGSGLSITGTVIDVIPEAIVPDSFFMGIGDGIDTYSVFTDDITLKFGTSVGNGIYVQTSTEFRQFDYATYFGGHTSVSGISVYNDNIYVLIEDTVPSPDVFYLYRINTISNLASSTVSLIDTTTNSVLTATNSNVQMFINATGAIYFTYQGGNSATQTIISKTTITGTTANTPTNITCSGTITAPTGFAARSDGHIIFTDSNENYERFNTSGVSQKFIDGYFGQLFNYLTNYYDGSSDNLYARTSYASSSENYKYKIQ